MKTRRVNLTDRFFAVYGLWQIVGAFSFLQPRLLSVYVLGTLVILATLWLDRRSLVHGESLRAQLHMPRALELEQTVHLQATLTGVAWPSLLPASIEWLAPGIRMFQFDQPRARFDVNNAGQSCVANHSATATGLGYFEWTALDLMVHSRKRWWLQTLEIEIAPQRGRIHPSFRHIPEQELVERMGYQRILTQGTRKLLRGQTTDQFYSVRRYQYPDHLRHIDAKKSAKYARLMTRIYDDFRAHHLVIALDLGRSMYGALKQSAKHDYYLSACLTLAQHAIGAGDYVSFFAFNQAVTFSIRSGRSLSQFEPVFRGDERLQARETESRFDLLFPTIASLSDQRSTVLVMTDLTSPSVQQDLLEALPPVCHRHLPLAVGLQDQRLFLNDLVWELDLDQFNTDMQARLFYAYWLNDQFDLFRAQVARLGGGVVQGSDHTWISLVSQVYARLRDSLRA